MKHQTNFIFTKNFKFHNNITIFEAVDLASHLLYIGTNYVPHCCFFAKILPKKALKGPGYTNTAMVACGVIPTCLYL